MVFFTGTLQEGISTALQQSKLVVCFVTDNQEESTTWETDYLKDEAIASSLESGAVVLRLEAGSQEAGFLAAIFPLPKNPTLVIIKNGQLKEYVSAGTLKDDFVKRVSAAFSAQTASQEQQTSAAAAPSAPSSTPAPAAPAPPTNPPAAAPPSGQQRQSSPGSSSGQTSALLAEAERRREVARKEREDIEKERRRKDKGKMPAAAAAADDPKAKQQQDAVKKASQQLAERQRQAREERARVLKLIEDDKAERRARQERERAERQAAAKGEEPMATPEPGTAVVAASSSSSMAKRHDQCAIQVRLFDGMTIRTRFSAKATLAQDVRKWIDENRTDGKDPYTFKVILTPLPNRAVDHATEEEQTLEELGLTPSSTLVLTPVDRYSSAYTSMNAGLSNPVSRLVTAVLAFVVNILGGIAGALGGLGSGASADSNGGAEQPEAPQQDRTQSQAATTGRDGGGRIKGFQNPDDRQKDYQLYNGNSVSLPRNIRDETRRDVHDDLNRGQRTLTT